jgi:hypothetical protein
MRGVGVLAPSEVEGLSFPCAAPRPRCAPTGASDNTTIAAAAATPPITRAFMLASGVDILC